VRGTFDAPALSCFMNGYVSMLIVNPGRTGVVILAFWVVRSA
jgi:hypothetical protein